MARAHLLILWLQLLSRELANALIKRASQLLSAYGLGGAAGCRRRCAGVSTPPLQALPSFLHVLVIGLVTRFMPGTPLPACIPAFCMRMPDA